MAVSLFKHQNSKEKDSYGQTEAMVQDLMVLQQAEEVQGAAYQSIFRTTPTSQEFCKHLEAVAPQPTVALVLFIFRTQRQAMPISS